MIKEAKEIVIGSRKKDLAEDVTQECNKRWMISITLKNLLMQLQDSHPGEFSRDSKQSQSQSREMKGTSIEVML